MISTQHTDRREALRALAQRRPDIAARLQQAVAALLGARSSLLEEIQRRAVFLSDIDQALAEDPDNAALAAVAAEKTILLRELQDLKALLDRGEAALRADPEWNALLNKVA